MFMKMSAIDQELLAQFVHERSEDAFTALVNRHVNLVFSAALRQVRSVPLAEEVCQSAFTQLATHAASLKPNTVLSAWLYQVTRRAAIDVVRCEARRQAREQLACQMSEIDDTTSGWTQIEPLLDEAMQELEDAERTAVLLRYFENKSLREVGEALGTSEDAAQKRVSRAVDHMRDFFSKRKIAVGAGGLAAIVSANAVQAAPAGLGSALASIALGIAGASTVTTASVSATVAKSIAMTTLQKTLVAAVTTIAAGAMFASLYQARQTSNLRNQVQTLTQQLQEQRALAGQAAELRRDRDRATNALAAVAAENESLKKGPNDTLKLRGEVGRLRQENAAIGSTSALSKVTANAEARKLLRDQQKFGMSLIYKGFAQQLKLSPEQTEKLNDLLADHIMKNVGNVTVALRDKLSLEDMDRLFATQDVSLQGQLQDLLGADGAAQYSDYSKNLLSTLTAEQFKAMLSGDDATKEPKLKQIQDVMRASVQAALANAGLPDDFQTVPILNFRNIASEQDGDRSLKLLEDIYQRAASLAGGFLSADELQKFKEFGDKAVSNNRAALSLNRTMMAPISN